MTREEAISVLKMVEAHGIADIAKTMAIQALEQEPCEDAVSRQAVIQIFDRWLANNDYNYSERNIMNCAISEIKDLPPVQPKRQTGKWIPVSERLPDKDGDYYVCYEQGYMEDYGLSDMGIEGFEVDCESFGYWHEYFDHHTLGSLGSEWERTPVIAWMPLPEPYKAESEEV